MDERALHRLCTGVGALAPRMSPACSSECPDGDGCRRTHSAQRAHALGSADTRTLSSVHTTAPAGVGQCCALRPPSGWSPGSAEQVVQRPSASLHGAAPSCRWDAPCRRPAHACVHSAGDAPQGTRRSGNTAVHGAHGTHAAQGTHGAASRSGITRSCEPLREHTELRASILSPSLLSGNARRWGGNAHHSGNAPLHVRSGDYPLAWGARRWGGTRCS